MGTKGMIVKKKISVGKTARKKLNEMEEALDVRYPSYNPLMKNRNTSYRGSPSKPGSTIFFDRLTIPEKNFK